MYFIKVIYWTTFFSLLSGSVAAEGSWVKNHHETSNLPEVSISFSWKKSATPISPEGVCHVGLLTEEGSNNATHSKEGVYLWVQLIGKNEVMSSMQFYAILEEEKRGEKLDLMRVAMSIKPINGYIRILEWGDYGGHDYFGVNCENAPYGEIPNQRLRNLLMKKFKNTAL